MFVVAAVVTAVGRLAAAPAGETGTGGKLLRFGSCEAAPAVSIESAATAFC
jgi:hypothetical protein